MLSVSLTQKASLLQHGFEALQAMIERRPGGESGISAVRTLVGDAIWAAAEAGEWSLSNVRRHQKTRLRT